MTNNSNNHQYSSFPHATLQKSYTSYKWCQGGMSPTFCKGSQSDAWPSVTHQSGGPAANWATSPRASRAETRAALSSSPWSSPGAPLQHGGQFSTQVMLTPRRSKYPWPSQSTGPWPASSPRSLWEGRKWKESWLTGEGGKITKFDVKVLHAWHRCCFPCSSRIPYFFFPGARLNWRVQLRRRTAKMLRLSRRHG